MNFIEENAASDNPINQEYISELFSSLPDFHEISTNQIRLSNVAEDTGDAGGTSDEDSRRKFKSKNLVSLKYQDKLNQKQFMETFQQVKLPKRIKKTNDYDLVILKEDEGYEYRGNISNRLLQQKEEQAVQLQDQEQQKSSKKVKNSKNKHPKIQRKRHDVKTVKERLQQTKGLSLFKINKGKLFQQDQQKFSAETDFQKDHEKHAGVRKYLSGKMALEKNNIKEKEISSNLLKESNKETKDHQHQHLSTDTFIEDRESQVVFPTSKPDWTASLIYNGPLKPNGNRKTSSANSNVLSSVRKKKQKQLKNKEHG